jgi:hypothetical protein
MRNTTEKFNNDSWCPSKDSNGIPPEHKFEGFLKTVKMLMIGIHRTIILQVFMVVCEVRISCIIGV